MSRAPGHPQSIGELGCFVTMVTAADFRETLFRWTGPSKRVGLLGPRCSWAGWVHAAETRAAPSPRTVENRLAAEARAARASPAARRAAAAARATAVSAAA